MRPDGLHKGKGFLAGVLDLKKSAQFTRLSLSQTKKEF